MAYRIRKGERKDAGTAFQLILELAEFENGLHRVSNTPEQFEEDGFGEEPVFQLLVGENEAGKICGIAIYFFGYSTWRGKMLFLDDLIVTAPARGEGLGKALVDEIFRIAQKEEIKLVKWQVLDWNTPAIDFYKKMGACMDGEWIDCKFSLKEIADYPFKASSR